MQKLKQITFALCPCEHTELLKMTKEEQCSVDELMNKAIRQYLAAKQAYPDLASEVRDAIKKERKT